MKNQTCMFTGHRNIKSEEIAHINDRLREEITKLIEQGYRFFGSGGARGFDALAALAVLDLREIYHKIKLILVLPCIDQKRLWNHGDIELHESIKCRADKIVYTSEFFHHGCMQKRNRHLVDNSGICIAYHTKKTGGTAFTVAYAERCGLPIINIAEGVIL